jgi:hypothetical protein
MTQVLEITQHLKPRLTKSVLKPTASSDLQPPQRTTAYRACRLYPKAVTLRLTTTEKEQLVGEARAASLSLSRYIASTLRDKKYPPSLPEKEILQQSLSLLLKLGINLNALRSLQENGKAKGVVEAVREVTKAVREVTKAVKHLRNRLKNLSIKSRTFQ